MPRAYPKLNIDWYSSQPDDQYGPWGNADEAYKDAAYECIKAKYGSATAHINKKTKLGIRLKQYLMYRDKVELMLRPTLEGTDRALACFLLGVAGSHSGLLKESYAATNELFENVETIERWSELVPERRKAFYVALEEAIHVRGLSVEAYKPISAWIIARLQERE